MAARLPRFLLPNGSLSIQRQSHFLLQNALLIQRAKPFCQYATTANPDKPKVLEKPTRFNPPSHGRRLKQQLPRSYGPELTEEQKTSQSKKKYPNMFPPEGTPMHWFLTNQGLHLWITLGTLVLLAGFTMFENWKLETPFKRDLPAREDLLTHPIRSAQMFVAAIQKSVNDNSQRVHQQRLDEMNDVHKQYTWRKAHGIEDKQGIGPWMPAEEKLALIRQRSGAEEEQEMLQKEAEQPKGTVKKWFGIW